MTYDKRKYPIAKWQIKPTSPSKRREKWITIMIRGDHYNMLREMKEYLDCTIGQAAMGAIEVEFNRLLQEASPGAQTFEFVPRAAKKSGRPKGAIDRRKRRPWSAAAKARAAERAAIKRAAKEARPTIEELLVPPPLDGKAAPRLEAQTETPPEAPTETPTETPTILRRKVYVPRF